MPSRRDLVAAAAALPVLGQAQPYKPKVFSAAELDLVAALADAIIPRTDTPGAADAKVELYIDRALSTRPAEAATFRKGLAAAARDRRPAAEIAAALHAGKDPFFQQLKNLTIDGYYSSREGLAGELGWKGYTPVHHFDGCTHEEHK